MSQTENAVIIEPHGNHKTSVIWLHGLGADGHDFEPIVPELCLPDSLGIRFIFPHAPMRPVTINAGMSMRAWYDVKNTDLRQEEDRDAIIHSSGLVKEWIESETGAGIATDKIVVAGFSQGGAIALHCGLRYPDRLAGILALSTYLPLPDTLSAEASNGNRAVPIMMLHGQYDPVIPEMAGRQSAEILKHAGYDVEWKSYPMPHAVCPEEIADISDWLAKQLA
ncbi:MAG: alpha/beta hydrolase-fold protein [Gammaproteobacteria bacterium]|jgi:phospholipase/carboxylesterase